MPANPTGMFTLARLSIYSPLDRAEDTLLRSWSLVFSFADPMLLESMCLLLTDLFFIWHNELGCDILSQFSHGCFPWLPIWLGRLQHIQRKHPKKIKLSKSTTKPICAHNLLGIVCHERQRWTSLYIKKYSSLKISPKTYSVCLLRI